MSNRDIITPSYFAQAFHDIDPEHPVTKTTSVLYWPHTNQEMFNKIVTVPWYTTASVGYTRSW